MDTLLEQWRKVEPEEAIPQTGNRSGLEISHPQHRQSRGRSPVITCVDTIVKWSISCPFS